MTSSSAASFTDCRMTPPDTETALRMLDAFASTGAAAFDVTVLDDAKDEEVNFQRNRSIDELRRTIGRRLQAAAAARHSLIIRPRSATALFVQLDDFSPERAAQIESHSFLTITTSPGNCQVWLSVSDGPKESDKDAARLFKTRVRRGAGSDHNATGATRIAGSINFKPKYAPAFPRVEVTRTSPGHTTTAAALERAGLLAPAEAPRPLQPPGSSAPSIPRRGPAPQHWPDYQQVLSRAPTRVDGKPDRSKADFFWSKYAAERGWSADEIAAKLPEVSERARERIKKRDAGYCRVVAENAVKSERDRKARRVAAPR